MFKGIILIVDKFDNYGELIKYVFILAVGAMVYYKREYLYRVYKEMK